MRAVSGHELWGVITAISEGVQDFEIGDKVYGMSDWFAGGATAEFCITLPPEYWPRACNGTEVRCKGHRDKVAARGDAVAAFNPTELIKEKMIIRVHP